jgi:hypothetical protein
VILRRGHTEHVPELARHREDVETGLPDSEAPGVHGGLQPGRVVVPHREVEVLTAEVDAAVVVHHDRHVDKGLPVLHGFPALDEVRLMARPA